MTGTGSGVPSSTSLEEQVRQALTTADIGRDILTVGLTDLGGFGAVTVTDETARIEIGLPVPHNAARATIKDEIVATVTGIEGIETVHCRWAPEAVDSDAHVDFLPEVKNVIAVVSGKGGVGKSTVAVNLAVALADAGAAVGLLDADIYGPNTPAMLGLSKTTPATTHQDRIVPREAHSVKAMSMGFLVDENDPVIWRGPMVDEMIQQLFADVQWGSLDYLIVDMPPGTGDAQLTLAQHLPVAGAMIVTTPQPVAVDDAERGLTMFARYDVPILGIAENMSGFRCPDCDTDHDIFGSGGAVELGERFDVPVLGRLPLDPAVGQLNDGSADAESGIDLPLVGRLAIPETRRNRERDEHQPPVAIRSGADETKDAMQLLATRTAARINHVGVQSD